MRHAAALLFCLLVLPGCVIVQVGVTNPIPGMTTVAVAPFFNLSHEPESVADGRRAAIAYYSELQKTPGFQVIPVGVVEQAIRENNLQLSRPDDALELCRVLGCDAVVVGAITDYDPYYPPRLGLQVSWFSPYPFAFEPGIAVDPLARRAMWKAAEDSRREASRQKAASRHKKKCDEVGRDSCRVPGEPDCPPEPVIRGQSDSSARSTANRPASLWWHSNQDDVEGPLPPSGMRPASPSQGIRIRPANLTDSIPRQVDPADWNDGPALRESADSPFAAQPIPTQPADSSLASPDADDEPRASEGHTDWSSRDEDDASGSSLERAAADLRLARQSRTLPTSGEPSPIAVPPAPGELPLRPVPPPIDSPPHSPVPSAIGQPAGPPPIEFDPRRPLMSYTRQFDGSDAALVAVLRDWLELSGDQRSGTWESALHRNEEFLRFCCHRMIVEMLTLHGGDAQRRIVIKCRRYR